VPFDNFVFRDKNKIIKRHIAMKYHTKIENLYLQIVPKNGLYHLYITDSDGTTELYESLSSPIALADDVYMQSTGCNELDDLDNADIPIDLSEWEKIN